MLVAGSAVARAGRRVLTGLVVGLLVLSAAACRPITAPTPEAAALPPPLAGTLSAPVSETLLPATETPPTDEPTTTPPPAEDAVELAPELVAAGLVVYRSQYCGVCHVLDAAETRGTFGPTHNGMATIAAQRIADASYTGKAQDAAGYIHESIVDPLAYIVPGYSMSSHRMPVYMHLSEADVDALTALLLSQQ
jgi:mono/diheme cytochrome c family protein